MRYYEVKFIKNGEKTGKPYTFGYDGELAPGAKVDLPYGHGEVVCETPEEVLSGMSKEKIKQIVKITEEEEDGGRD